MLSDTEIADMIANNDWKPIDTLTEHIGESVIVRRDDGSHEITATLTHKTAGYYKATSTGFIAHEGIF